MPENLFTWQPVPDEADSIKGVAHSDGFDMVAYVVAENPNRWHISIGIHSRGKAEPEIEATKESLQDAVNHVEYRAKTFINNSQIEQKQAAAHQLAISASISDFLDAQPRPGAR